MINDWNAQEVKNAELRWGNKRPPFFLDMLDFALSNGNSFLELGCGFGRTLQYLIEQQEEPNYIGYDSSPAMIDRITENFPYYSARIFQRDITTPFGHKQDIIFSLAVFIHITLNDQIKVLQQIKKAKPKAFTFDINCASEQYLLRADHFENIIMSGFRMTWQSHYKMTQKVLSMFPEYLLSIKFYPLNNRNKVVYMLRRKGN